MAQVVCFVLKPGADRQRVGKVAGEAGLVLANRIEGDGERLSYEEAWTTPDLLTTIAYVEDPLVNLAYMAFRGRDVERLIASVIPKLPVYTREEALYLAKHAQTRNDQVRGLYRLAVMFPEYDQAAFDVFKAFSTHAEPSIVREAAVDAMVYRCWPQFIPLLEAIKSNDPDAKVRKRASEILPHVREAGGQTGATAEK